MPTGEVAIYSIERRFQTGPFSREDCLRLDPLRPHLARAALLSMRAGLQRAWAVVSLLEALDIPGAVIPPSGKLRAANKSFERLLPKVFQDRSERLRLVDRRADELFAAAVEAVAGRASERNVGSIPLPSNDYLPLIIVHLLPVRGLVHDIFLDTSAIVLVTPLEQASVPGAEILQGLFDLTPAEARVTHGIGSALNIDDLAQAPKVSVATVGIQVKAVLAKTGTRRQAGISQSACRQIVWKNLCILRRCPRHPDAVLQRCRCA